jgi:hypothetical protein
LDTPGVQAAVEVAGEPGVDAAAPLVHVGDVGELLLELFPARADLGGEGGGRIEVLLLFGECLGEEERFGRSAHGCGPPDSADGLVVNFLKS